MPEECRSCHAEIDWAYQEPKEGPAADGWQGERPKSNPINHDSADDPKGNLIIWRDRAGVLRYRYKRKGETPRPGEHTGISHFATCKDGKQHRKTNRNGPEQAGDKPPHQAILGSEGGIGEMMPLSAMGWPPGSNGEAANR